MQRRCREREKVGGREGRHGGENSSGGDDFSRKEGQPSVGFATIKASLVEKRRSLRLVAILWYGGGVGGSDA